MSNQISQEYVLGIDLGSNSLGWAIIGLIDDEPAQLVRAGTRVFEAGMEGDLSSGREESRNLKRREARSHRRLLWRRKRRMTKLFNLLQRFQLLPLGQGNPQTSVNGHRMPITPEQRQDLLNELDQQILQSSWFKAKAHSGAFPEPEHTMPYVLRASALGEAIEPYFLGRAIYHLAQRRGFLSNRKQAPKKQDDDGAVKEGIAELRKAMHEAGAHTLGEYFSRLHPSIERIRCRWTSRDMYENEFNAIWDKQAEAHSGLLTADRKKQIHGAIFHQRPLRFDPGAIGKCELEPGESRAPAHLLVSQRFRLLQTVNNLKVLPPDDIEMPLAPGDRKKVIDELETKGDRTFKQFSKLLNLEKGYGFNLENGGEKRIKGNRTNADFHAAFGEQWLAMSPKDRDHAVQYVYSFQRPEKLKAAARKKWNLSDEQAEKLAGISLESDYMNLSRKAIQKFIPLLEQGITYGEARRQLYPESFQAREALPTLPPVEMCLKEIRNPAVMRSLTELRKVVNAIVRQFGKPAYVHVELARDLKKSKKQRQAISENNRRNEKARAEAAKQIIAAAGIGDPKSDDIRKFLLAEECCWMCPYTGKSISASSLFGPEPQFDIEHIIPFSRSMDNSFQNLTLCYVPENRNLKGNKTPWQAYHGNPAQYEAILERIRKFNGDRRAIAAKLKRFTLGDEELEEFLEEFRNRQLNDTAYATSLAARYLGLLYGGVSDADGRKRIQATSGQATAYFRSLWKLNSVLNDGPTNGNGAVPKSREDHRHHAVDAVVIGLTDAAMIKRLSDAAQRATLEHRRRFASLEAPWPNFADSVRAEIAKVIVSHRVSKKVSGALHEETIYSPPIGPDGEVRVRKPLASLTKPEVQRIADKSVRKLVQQKLEELGGIEPKKAFSNSEKLPRFPSSGVVIKSVRISKPVPTFTLGGGRSTRHVTSESNHHVEIYAELDGQGNEGKWDGEVVSMSEAYQRLRAGKPIVQRDHGPLVRFKFSIASGEVIECDDGKGARARWVSRGVTLQAAAPRLSLVPLADARKKEELVRSGVYWRPFLNPLRKRNPRKVVVSPLGEVTEAHD